MTWSLTFELVAALTVISVGGLLYLRWASASLDRQFDRENAVLDESRRTHG